MQNKKFCVGVERSQKFFSTPKKNLFRQNFLLNSICKKWVLFFGKNKILPPD